MMRPYVFNSLNEAWAFTLLELLEGSDSHKVESRAGGSYEIIGSSFTLSHTDSTLLECPQRKLSGAYAAAELLWLLSADRHVERLLPYAPSYKRFTENGIAWGAYGHRWQHDLAFKSERANCIEGLNEFNESMGATANGAYGQLTTVIDTLRKFPASRQAIITCWNAGDLVHALIGDKKDLPCTLSLQFLLRSGRLHCVATMRSNDVWLGMPYDVFCFTSIQRIIAQALGVATGHYTHNVGSLHLYSRNEDDAVRCLDSRRHWEYVYSQGAKQWSYPNNADQLFAWISEALKLQAALHDPSQMEAWPSPAEIRNRLHGSMFSDLVLACRSKLDPSLDAAGVLQLPFAHGGLAQLCSSSKAPI